jgi:AraC-like DNA-binding protein
MEWHFDASVLDVPCPNANPITAQVCQQFCDVVMAERPGEGDLARKIRAACLNSSRRFPAAEEMAEQLGLSLRTLHRRLATDGLSYQEILDNMRRSVAIVFSLIFGCLDRWLHNTNAQQTVPGSKKGPVKYEALFGGRL